MRVGWLLVASLMTACHRESPIDTNFNSDRGGLYWSDRPSIALMPEFQAVASGARLADKVVFYEGLPHPMFESDSFAEEKTTKRTNSLHGWLFYEQPLVMQAEDLQSLRAACADPENFRTQVGISLCGGFHPDYELSWQQGDRRFDFQFCFGCEEAKLYLEDTEALCVDMKTSVFKPLLTKYRAQRPIRH